MRRLTSDPLQILTVSEVTRGIKNALETQFDGIRIEGELSSFRPNQSGHWYFSLKDENAVLSAAMFQGANRKVRFDVKEGLRVVATGRISVYEPRGTYQLIVDDLQPAGLGALQIRFEELKRKLEAE